MPRFRCLTCGRTCSLQTFAFSYYLKRPGLSEPVAAGLVAGSAHRQIARSMACAPSTVTRRSARLGRHALLLSSLAWHHLSALGEPAVVDHFETFTRSQDEPCGLATVVGQRSWFLYGLDPAPHRRGGRLSPFQRRRARRRAKPKLPAGAYRRSFARVLDLLAERAQGARSLAIVSDAHQAYGRALAGHRYRHAFRHRVFPNPARGPKGAPRSPEARARDRAMFASDLLHSLLRHSCAHHRRETIAFGRRLDALLERGFLFAAWRNFVKARSERRGGSPTPAMALSLTRERWTWPRVLARRLFPSRLQVPAAWLTTYRRAWHDPPAAPWPRHRLKNAY